VTLLDFSLSIEDAGGGNFQAQIIDSPSGKGGSAFRLPVSPQELDNLLYYLQQAHEMSLALDSPEMNAVREFGWGLFNAIFTPDLEIILRKSLNMAASQNAVLRLRLNLPDAPQLWSIPWEYLFYPYANSFLTLIDYFSLARFSVGGREYRKQRVELPLKAIALLKEADDPAYRAFRESGLDAERRGLLEIDETTLAELPGRLAQKEYHLLVYSGVLPEDRDSLLDSVQLHTSLGFGLVLPCAGSDTAGMREFARQLSTSIPSVLLPFAGFSPSAGTFLNSFFSAFLNNPSPDAALAATRTHLFNSGFEVDWGEALLFTSTAEAVLFELAPPDAEKQKRRLIESLQSEVQNALSGQDWEKAISRLEELLAINPALEEERATLDRLKAEQEIKLLYRHAVEDFETGNWSAALDKFQELDRRGGKEKYPDLDNFIREASNRVARTRNRNEAQELYGTALVALALNDLNMVENLLTKALQLDPDFNEAREKLEELRQQKLMLELYTHGQEYYRQENWQEAVGAFRQLRELDRFDRYPDVAELLAECEGKAGEVEKHNAVRQLYTEAEHAAELENWTVVKDRLEKLLQYDPENNQALTLLETARTQLKMAELFKKGQQCFEIGDLPGAVEYLSQLRELDGLNQFRDAVPLLAEAENRIHAAEKEKQATTLQAEAEEALQKENWSTAIRKLEILLAVDTQSEQARQKMVYARHQQRISNLYSKSMEHYRAGRLSEALDNLKLLRQLDTESRYKDAILLIGEVETRQRQMQVTALYTGAQNAYRQQQWGAAEEKLVAALQLDPAFKDADILLDEVRHHNSRNGNGTKPADMPDAPELLPDLIFEMEIRPISTGFQADIVRSPAGKAVSTFSIPATPQQLDNLLYYLEQARDMSLTMDSPEMVSVRQFGWALFNAIFTPDLEMILRQSLSEAAARNTCLQFRLKLPDDPALATVPWEYLFYPYANSYFLLVDNLAMVRYRTLPQNQPPLQLNLPLNLLALAASPDGYPQFDRNQTWQTLSESLLYNTRRGLVNFEKLKAVSLSALQQQLWKGQYHVVVFSGPVVYDSQQQPCLMFEDEQDQPVSITVENLLDEFKTQNSVRLVFLLPSEGSDRHATLDFANRLATGVPAVIAPFIRFSLPGCAPFFSRFFTDLAAGITPDIALTNSRLQTFKAGFEVEWGAPVLFTASDNTRIFDIVPLEPEKQREHLKVALQDEAHTAIQREEWDNAIKRLEELLEVDPSLEEERAKLTELKEQQDKAALYQQGRDFYETEKWPESIKAFRELRQRDVEGQYYIVEWLLADAERKQEETKKQKELAGLYELAQKAVQEEEWDAAVERLDAIMAIDEEYRDASTMLSIARVRLQQAQALIPTMFAEATQAIEDKNWSLAVANLVELLAADPNHAEAQEKLAMVRQQQTLEALYMTTGEKLVEKNWPVAAENLARLKERDREQQYRQFIEESEAVLSDVSIRTGNLLAVARVALEDEEWDKAIEKLEGVLEIEPHHAEATEKIQYARLRKNLKSLYEAGREHYQAGRWREAADAFRELKVLDHGEAFKDADWYITDTNARINEENRRAQANALFVDAQSSLERQSFDSAILKFENLVSINPYNQDAQSWLTYTRQQQKLAELYKSGRAYFEEGRWRETIDTMRQVQMQDTQGKYPDIPSIIAESEMFWREEQRDARPQPQLQYQQGPQYARYPQPQTTQTLPKPQAATATAAKPKIEKKPEKKAAAPKNTTLPENKPPKVRDTQANFRAWFLTIVWIIFLIALLVFIILRIFVIR
jgi:outer membrane protein assembly factor BamD (BamD/ComL family)